MTDEPEIDEEWAEAAKLSQKSWTEDNPWEEDSNDRQTANRRR